MNKRFFIFTGCLLFVMNADIDAHHSNDKKMDQRISERSKVRVELRKRPDVHVGPDGALEIEDRNTLFLMLQKLDDMAHKLSMIVDLAVYEPWSDVKRLSV